MNREELRVIDGAVEEGQPLPRERRTLFFAMIAGVIISGIAFAYKLAEFIWTISSPAAQGFADVPVTVYFFVASGWLSLLAWCYFSGKFDNHAAAKYEMLAQEEAYELRGE